MVIGSLFVLLMGCAPVPAQQTTQASQSAMEGYSPAQEFEIVDCLLPPDVRMLGSRVYMGPRRPTRTTVADCKIRGGESQAYDRTDYMSSLNVWMPLANEGDAEAQTFVGNLYEKGVGGPADYAKAAEWYQKAADQDFRRAQFLLGALYEQGLGVVKDVVLALNLYRQSQGVSDDDLVFKATAQRALEKQRAELQQLIDGLEQQLEESAAQIEALQGQIAQIDNTDGSSAQTIATLQGLVDSLQRERQGYSAGLDDARVQIDGLPPAGPSVAWPDGGAMPRSRQFGEYHALIIGVQNYSVLGNLRTPLNDAARIGQVLETKYGFRVVSLEDPSDLLIKKTINDLFTEVGENDNLLVYFAGHGNRTPSGDRETGYWMPSNAERPPSDTYWVANEFVTNHLARIKAKRVMVVSDSSYAGLISDDPNLLIGDGYETSAYIKYKLPDRSRLLLVSGVDSPVPDRVNGENSVFAGAFLDALSRNTNVLSAPGLYTKMFETLTRSGSGGSGDGVPSLKAIGGAGHESGDFFFVPTTG